MSVYQLNKLCYRIHHDPALQAAMRTDPARAVREFILSEEEQEALLAGDVAQLFRMGVHPFLLSHLARYELLGLTRCRYHDRIRALASER